ncbi:hypothetical protein NE237_006563 [Protea cynaroides]|uniref:Uncharacterized protein n=1 Tax=Protea cynaroides TaxID=273540 RepID=A0A9Q0KND8_9MAGN|nr:hypothetical protein NE237_006563 [Protea cynaroides]
MVQRVEDKETEHYSENDDKDEGEINLEAELTSALDDLDDERRKIKKISELLNAKNEEVSTLTEELEESKKTSDELEEQLSLKVIENNILMEKVFSLNLQLEEQELKIKSLSSLEEEFIKLKETQEMMETESPSPIENVEIPQVEGSRVLDEILSAQRPARTKYGLGFIPESSQQEVARKGRGGTAKRRNPATLKQKGKQVIFAQKGSTIGTGKRCMQAQTQGEQSTFRRNRYRKGPAVSEQMSTRIEQNDNYIGRQKAPVKQMIWVMQLLNILLRKMFILKVTVNKENQMQWNRSQSLRMNKLKGDTYHLE